MPFLWQIKFLWHYYPPCHFCGTENISRIEKCMCSPHTSRSNCHFCGMVGNNVINQFCASFVAWRVTTFKKGAGWIGLIKKILKFYFKFSDLNFFTHLITNTPLVFSWVSMLPGAIVRIHCYSLIIVVSQATFSISPISTIAVSKISWGTHGLHKFAIRTAKMVTPTGMMGFTGTPSKFVNLTTF